MARPESSFISLGTSGNQFKESEESMREQFDLPASKVFPFPAMLSSFRWVFFLAAAPWVLYHRVN